MNERKTISVTLTIITVALCLGFLTPSVYAVSSSISIDTETEWGDNTDTIENLTYSGGVLEISMTSGVFSDSFEDESADSGVPNDWTETQTIDGSIEVSTTYASDGSQSVYISDSSNSGSIKPSEQSYSTAKTEPVSVDIYSTGDFSTIRLYEGGTRKASIGMKNGDLKYHAGSSYNTISTVPNNDEWVHIRVENLDTSSDTVDVYWEAGSDSGSSQGLSTEGDFSNGYDETRLHVYRSTGYFDDFQIGESSTPPSGSWLSKSWSPGTDTYDVDNLEFSSTIGTGENIYAKILKSTTYSSWDNKVKLSVDGTSSAHYQKKLIVNYGSGTNSPPDVYCNSNCESDFSDLRFADSGGNELDYWIQKYNSSDNAVVWVEMPDDKENIYMYYGNSGASSASNEDFFFQDFTATKIGQLPYGGEGLSTTTDGVIYHAYEGTNGVRSFWTENLKSKENYGFPTNSAGPLILENSSGTDLIITEGSNSDELVARTRNSDTEVWNIASNTYWTMGLSWYDNGNVKFVITTADDGLKAYNLDTGNKVWEASATIDTSSGNSNNPTPAVDQDNGYVYSQYDGGIMKVDAETGTKLEDVSLSPNEVSYYNTALVDDEHGYHILAHAWVNDDTSTSNYLYCLDENLNTEWSVNDFSSSKGPGYYDGLVIMPQGDYGTSTSYRKHVKAYDIDDGSVVWEANLENYNFEYFGSEQTIVDGVWVAPTAETANISGTPDGSVFLVDARTGRVLDFITMDHRRSSCAGALVTNGKLFVANLVNETTEVWDIGTGENIQRLGSFSENGQYQTGINPEEGIMDWANTPNIDSYDDTYLNNPSWDSFGDGKSVSTDSTGWTLLDDKDGVWSSMDLQASSFQVEFLYETDGDHTPSLDSYTLNVSTADTNDPPTASFTADDPALTDEDINFDASGSSDSDGTIENYAWDFEDTDDTWDLVGATETTPAHSYPDDGSYTVELKVWDNAGATDAPTQSVTVNNRSPTADFTYTISDLTVNTDGANSYDNDGNISTYRWDWTSDGSWDSTGETASHTYASKGEYDITLQVEDDDGGTDNIKKTVAFDSPTIESIIVDNTLIDRDQDLIGSNPVLGTTITVQVSDPDGTGDITESHLTIYDPLDSKVIDNITLTGGSTVNENTLEYTYAYDPSDDLSNQQLGSFDLLASASDVEGNWVEKRNDGMFDVSDIVEDHASNQENIAGHKHRIYYNNVLGHLGNHLSLTSATLIDSNTGTESATVSGENYEGIYTPTSTGKVYAEIEADRLDGYSDNLSYSYPSLPPEIYYFNSTETLIDRDSDTDKISGIYTTQLSIKVRDPDNRDDLENIYGRVLDNLGNRVSSTDITSSATVLDENSVQYNWTWNAPNSMYDSGLGQVKIGGLAEDKYGRSSENYGFDNLHVKDYEISLNLDPNDPAVGFGPGENYTASGTINILGGGTVDFSTADVTDEYTGTFDITSNDYSKSIEITASPGTEVNVWTKAGSTTLDGYAEKSYTANENQTYTVYLRREDNNSLVNIQPDDNFVVRLHFPNSTKVNRMKTNPDSFTIEEDVLPEKASIRVNDQYTRSRININGSLTFWVTKDYNAIGEYELTLQDFSGLYGFPDGYITIMKYYNDQLQVIDERYWDGEGKSYPILKIGRDYFYRVTNEITGDNRSFSTTTFPQTLTKTIDVSGGFKAGEMDFTQSLNDSIRWGLEWEDDNLLVSYEDNSNGTENVILHIYHDNTEVYTNTRTGNLWTDRYNAAENGAYWVRLEINHTEWGFSPFPSSKTTLKGISELPPIPGAAWFDDMPVPATNMAVFVMFFVLLISFGPAVAGAGVMIVATLMSLINVFLPITLPWPIVGILFFIGFIMQMWAMKRG